MKKSFKRFVGGIFSAIVALLTMTTPLVSHAETKITESSPYTQKIYLYMLVDSDINYWSFKTYYELNYYRDYAEREDYPSTNNRGYDLYTIDLYCPDYRVVGTLEGYPDYKIYEIIKPIPTGNLCIAPCNMPSGESNYTMTRDYKAPFEGWGHYLQGDYVNSNDEYFEVRTGDVVTAYAIYGSDDLIYDDELWSDFAYWAKENDAEVLGQIEYLIEGSFSEPVFSFDDAANVIEQNKTEIEDDTVVEQPVVEIPERTNTSVTTVVLEPEEPEQKSLPPVVVIVLGVVALVGLMGGLTFIRNKVRK